MTAEWLRRVKLNGEIRSHSPLSRLVELELLLAATRARRSRDETTRAPAPSPHPSRPRRVVVHDLGGAVTLIIRSGELAMLETEFVKRCFELFALGNYGSRSVVNSPRSRITDQIIALEL
jgi:hypothetical protein